MKSKQNIAVTEAYKKGYRAVKGIVIYKNNKTKPVLTCGYYNFGIRLNGETIMIPIHRLVAYEKYGVKIFEKGIQVRHLDSNSLNNLHDNISIGTPTENSYDRPEIIRMSMAIHASSFVKKYDHEEIVRLYNEEGLSYGKIMKKLGISSKGTISFIIKNSIASKKINL